MTLLGHLTELRRRLIVSLVTFVIGMVVCWAFAADIYRRMSQLVPGRCSWKTKFPSNDQAHGDWMFGLLVSCSTSPLPSALWISLDLVWTLALGVTGVLPLLLGSG